ncbi:hypothetical protein RRF57_007116 [Xylaria bambusicola]|uniref:Uncharacterized protein n=1 Tax=Xylaria bambusicola TaxID=326684 RepID=A0AAN7Z7B3_9PEZI
MQTKIFAAMFLFASLGATQDLDLGDFPRACQQVCQDISRLSNDCDNQTSNDRDEINLVCNGDNAEEQAKNCAACVKANVRGGGGDDDHDDDLVDAFLACGWNYDDVSSTTTSSTASSTAAAQGAQAANRIWNLYYRNFSSKQVTSTEPASPTNTESDAPDNAAAGVTAGVGVVVVGLMAALLVIL